MIFFKYKDGPCNISDILILKFVCINLKFKFDWKSYILSGSRITYIGLKNKAEKVSYYNLIQEQFITC